MDRKLYCQYGKKHGPGGPRCVCCNDYGVNPRKSKPLERRLVRRKMKQELRDELQRHAD